MTHLFSTLAASLPAVLDRAAALLVTAIWQGAIVGAGLAIALRLTGRTSAALRFALWSAAFLTVAGLPFLPLLLPANAQPYAGSISAAGPLLALDGRWSVALGLVWLAASLYRAADLAVHSIRLRQLWKSATPVHPAVAAGASGLRGRKPVELCTTRNLDRPSVIGFFAPRILIPDWLLPCLSAGELDQIVLHETEHLRRGDDWTNLLQKLSLILFPLNPVLLWMERQLCLEREMACDEAVIRITRSPRAYAACLTSLAERGLSHRASASAALSLGVWQRRPELARRVYSLLRNKPTLGPWGTRALAASLACLLVFGSVEFARCPQLVAFVPARSADSARIGRIETHRDEGGAREVLTAWRPASQERSTRAYRTEVRATVPADRNSHFVAGSSTNTLNLAAQPTPRLTPAPRQILLTAEPPEFARASETGWIVLTAYEEIASPYRQAGIASDSSEGGAIESPGRATVEENIGAESQPGNPAPGQIAVTRVVFRVVPTSFASPSPTAVRLRNGWLVFQL